MTDLAEILAEAQRFGWIGRGPLDEQVRHAGAFTQLLGEGPGVVFDLGSGGGLPALPGAVADDSWSWVLVESQLRRADFLVSATRRLGLTDRVSVVHARAEDVGRDASHRGSADVVTARSFGPPAAVAECAAPLLRLGGRLVVSDPPGGADRWPADGLAGLGLGLAERHTVDGLAFVRLVQATICSDRYPRKPGIPAKSPLF